MTIRFVLLCIAAVTFTSPASAQTATPSPNGPYVLFQGTMGQYPVTMMIDEATGETWFLGARTSDGQVWSTVPLAKSADVKATGWVPIGVLTAAAAKK